jgi:hypothetical protein
VMSVTISAWKRKLWLMSYYRCLWLPSCSAVQARAMLCCFRIVYLMLPVSLDCSFVIAPSVFSNVYLFLRFFY